MTTWEYRTISMYEYDDVDAEPTEPWFSQLQRAGRDGWEVVAQIEATVYQRRAKRTVSSPGLLLKRPLTG